MRIAGAETLGEIREAYVEALVGHDGARARQLIEGAVEAGVSVPGLYLGVIQPALYEIGERWADGRINVADEHHASMITHRVLALLSERMRVPPRDGRLAVATCTPGELHELGAQIIADFLEADGWEVLRLGASTPVDALAELVEAERPDVVALSTAMPDRLDGAADALRALAAVRPRPCIVVGGLGWRGERGALASELGADLLVDDAGTLVEILAQRFPPRDDY